MKLDGPLAAGLSGLLGTTVIRTWMSTLDYRVRYYDRDVDPLYPECRGRRIYVFWHEYILIPLYVRAHCNLAMLVSRHRDAAVLSRVAGHMGFDFVRGSTRRGGAEALLELAQKSRHKHLTITPDGPRGPRRKMALGAVYLASKLGLPLVLMGRGLERPWRLNSWDRFAVPRPYSRARGVLSPDLRVPPDLDRDGLEHFRLKAEDLLNRITGLAEAWAESGRRKPGEQVVERRPAPRIRRFDAPNRARL